MQELDTGEDIMKNEAYKKVVEYHFEVMNLTTRITRKYPQQNEKLRLPQNHKK
jgi:hypothetical protein